MVMKRWCALVLLLALPSLALPQPPRDDERIDASINTLGLHARRIAQLESAVQSVRADIASLRGELASSRPRVEQASATAAATHTLQTSFAELESKLADLQKAHDALTEQVERQRKESQQFRKQA